MTPVESDEAAEASEQEEAHAAPDNRRAGLSTRARRQLVIALVAVIAAAAVVAVLVGRSGSSSHKEVPQVLKAGQSAAIGGRTWHAIQGDWATSSTTFAIKTPGRSNASLLVTDSGLSDVTVQARMPVVAGGAGLVFRYRNPFNYWALRAVPGVASWQVVKVVDGKSVVVRNTGLSPTRNGTLVIVSTRTDGAIAISFNQRLTTTLNDPALAIERGTGFLALGSRANRAVFTDFATAPALPATPLTSVAPTTTTRRPPAKRP